MVRRPLLGSLLLVAIWLISGCLELDRQAPEYDGLPDWQGDQPASWDEQRSERVPAPALAEPMDVTLCETLARQERACAGDGEATLDVQDCAARLACSRRLWRLDAAAVYRCVADRPCDDDDPVMSCLRQVGAAEQPTTAEMEFAAHLEQAERQCGDMVEVAPGQADAIYEGLSFCLTENDECDVKGACVEVMLQAIVDQTCGER